MKVRFICGYYSDLAHKNKMRRPEDYWDALNFCWGVKVGAFKPKFNIHDANGKTPITAQNFHLVRRKFGEWIEKSVAVLNGGADVVLVPVPSKDGLVGAGAFRTLDMTRESLKGTKLAANVQGALRWNKKLTKAHEGGNRSRALLAPLLTADSALNGKRIILVDDILTKGCSLLAAEDAIRAAGGTVLGAVVCGKTIYNLDIPNFGEQEFELNAELDDWHG